MQDVLALSCLDPHRYLLRPATTTINNILARLQDVFDITPQHYFKPYY